MKLLINILLGVFLYAGYIYIEDNSLRILYAAFALINFFVIKSLLKSTDLQKNIIYLYTSIGWFLFNLLGFIHDGLINKTNYINERIEVYCIFILSTILLYIPIITLRKKITRKFKTLNFYNLSTKTVLLILITAFSFQLYKVASGGGFYNYMYAQYGAKTEIDTASFFNLFGGFINILTNFLVPFLCLKYNTTTRITVFIYWISSIIINAIGGGSLAFLSPMIYLYTFLYFTYNTPTVRRNLKKYFTIIIALAVVGGLIIRVNRKSMDDFQLSSLSESIVEVMESPTFDNVSNMRIILDKVDPAYEINQFILPFVHMLPRSVFTWKPMEFGRIIGFKYLGVTEESMAGFITSPMGDFYYDFGILGIIAGMLFIGTFITYISERLNNSRKTPFNLAVTLIFAGSSSTLYSWYTGVFSSYIKLLIVLLIIILVNKIFKPQI